MRVGIGYDVHKLTEGRKLILGGVEIPHTLGLLGHSDADVLLHAIMDALLGAAALGDIGKHFPDTEEQYRGISSDCAEAQAPSLYRRNGTEHCRGPGGGRQSSQCKGHYGGRARVYRL